MFLSKRIAIKNVKSHFKDMRYYEITNKSKII